MLSRLSKLLCCGGSAKVGIVERRPEQPEAPPKLSPRSSAPLGPAAPPTLLPVNSPPIFYVNGDSVPLEYNLNPKDTILEVKQKIAKNVPAKWCDLISTEGILEDTILVSAVNGTLQLIKQSVADCFGPEQLESLMKLGEEALTTIKDDFESDIDEDIKGIIDRLPDTGGVLPDTGGVLDLSCATLKSQLGRSLRLGELAKIGQSLKGKNLKSLNLAGHNLKVIPAFIGQLTTLETLDLSGNQLTALPESIVKLTALKTLKLNDNKLEALPAFIGQLTTLQTLMLHKNELTALRESFGDLKALIMLDISKNQLTALPESFGNLKALERLDLEGNQLTALPESFGDLTALNSLNLYDNKLTALPKSFGQLINLQSLCLSGNQLTALPKFFRRLAAFCGFRNGINALPASLRRQLPNLQSIN